MEDKTRRQENAPTWHKPRSRALFQSLNQPGQTSIERYPAVNLLKKGMVASSLPQQLGNTLIHIQNVHVKTKTDDVLVIDIANLGPR